MYMFNIKYKKSDLNKDELYKNITIHFKKYLQKTSAWRVNDNWKHTTIQLKKIITKLLKSIERTM